MQTDKLKRTNALSLAKFTRLPTGKFSLPLINLSVCVIYFLFLFFFFLFSLVVLLCSVIIIHIRWNSDAYVEIVRPKSYPGISGVWQWMPRLQGVSNSGCKSISMWSTKCRNVVGHIHKHIHTYLHKFQTHSDSHFGAWALNNSSSTSNAHTHAHFQMQYRNRHWITSR